MIHNTHSQMCRDGQKLVDIARLDFGRNFKKWIKISRNRQKWAETGDRREIPTLMGKER